jgi:hypothetical protein
MHIFQLATRKPHMLCIAYVMQVRGKPSQTISALIKLRGK